MNYAVVIGGSAGSFRILSRIIPVLSPNFNFSVVICVHRHRSANDTIVAALEKNELITIKEAEEGEILQKSTVYIAPANFHLLFDNTGRFNLSDSPPVNYSRPSIDLTMMSAAEQYGEKLMGILLSGANPDGAEGMKTISEQGGITIVQDPANAEISVMPKAAVESFAPTHILSDDKIINFIQNLGDSL